MAGVVGVAGEARANLASNLALAAAVRERSARSAFREDTRLRVDMSSGPSAPPWHSLQPSTTSQRVSPKAEGSNPLPSGFVSFLSPGA